MLQSGASATPGAALGAGVFSGGRKAGQVPGEPAVGGNLTCVFHFHLLQLIAACEAKQVFDILSASALLLESKDKCSLSTGEKPGENLR